MQTVPFINKEPYGECALCGYVGSVHLHHIIPRRLNVKTDRKAKLIFAENGRYLFSCYRKEKIEDLMIEVCSQCHMRLHPENWKYYRKQNVLEKIEQVIEENQNEH